MDFVSQLTGTAWSFIPVLLIFFLFAGILVAYYVKIRLDEMSIYLKSIATSLEKLAQRVDPDAEMLRRRSDNYQGPRYT